ncbi:MAG: hypothetical protein DSY42_04455 [Aquifex sp.]|nr:MAG: hypothetical protein DSY42_04455 [Aquifex sp.]
MEELNLLVLYYLLEILSRPEGHDKADKILLTLLQGLVVDVLKQRHQKGYLRFEDLKRFESLLLERLDAFGRGSASVVGGHQDKEMRREELLFLIAQAKERLKEMTKLLLRAVER